MIIFKHLIILLLVCISTAQGLHHNKSTLYDYYAISIDGDTIRMEEYKGRKILVVNVASKCGYTNQYKELQRMHEVYGKELTILGFPSNDFFWQEPGNNSEIKSFCQREYGVTFQMLEKIHVKGRKQHPIYQWLSESQLNGWNNKSPSWNFYKYLINEKGELINYYPSSINPMDTTIIQHLNSMSSTIQEKIEN